LIFTKSTAYALQALMELAKFEKPIDVTKLSEITALPKPFLAKLLQTLSKKGFVKSFKGVKGGFILAKQPQEIKILDLFKVLEEKNLVFYCSNDKSLCTRGRKDCPLWKFFSLLENDFKKILEKYTLLDLIRIESA
jgi:Rrf2 family protein